MGCHEIDILWADVDRRHDEIAFIFAVFIVHQDDHAPGANLIEQLFGGGQG